MEESLGTLIAFVVLIFIGMWAYKDAVSRGKSTGEALFWAIGIFLLLIIFLPLWLFIRPAVKTPAIVHAQVHEPKLCPHCGKYYDNTPSFCPNCGAKL